MPKVMCAFELGLKAMSLGDACKAYIHSGQLSKALLSSLVGKYISFTHVSEKTTADKPFMNDMVQKS